MLVWIASYSRSGNTFFRVVLTHLYDVSTYAAFDAGEVLVNAGAQELVAHKGLPEPLRSAMSATHDRKQAVKDALAKLDADDEIYIFKTHAGPADLMGHSGKTILVVRDGRDSLASFANFFIDIGQDLTSLKNNVRNTVRAPLSPGRWFKLAREVAGTARREARIRLGMRDRLVTKQLDRLLSADSTYLSWAAMNEAWLKEDPRPVIVHFNDLVANPVETVTGAVEALGIELPRKAGQKLPTFDELKAQYPNFFRKGKSGDWKNWFSDGQEKRFWERSGAVMKELGLGT